jgi:hypothetical protein
MKVAIMQPYIFPYLGYFQLINAVDKFVIYDNIKFTKKGWINRNRILVNGKDEYISFPLKNGSDYLHVSGRELADSFPEERARILRKITAAYKNAPEYINVFPLLSDCINYVEKNLFLYIYHTLQQICSYLQISTELIVSSTIPIDHDLRSQEKVLAICKATSADTYINPPGGVGLYSRQHFEQNKIKLQFIQPDPGNYVQFGENFVPWLSIIDVMMFNSREQVQKLLHAYTII